VKALLLNPVEDFPHAGCSQHGGLFDRSHVNRLSTRSAPCRFGVSQFPDNQHLTFFHGDPCAFPGFQIVSSPLAAPAPGEDSLNEILQKAGGDSGFINSFS
jgi:hypothetical protein